jgi:putative ABC transport system permease protein
MGNFAWRNLLTRPLRTALALVGLTIPILGVIGLFSVSNGLRDLVGDTLSKIEGVIVLSESAPTPIFSRLAGNLPEKLRKIPGVRAVAPEVWALAPSIEGQDNILSRGLKAIQKGPDSLLDTPVVVGQDLAAHANLKSAVFPRAIRDGRFLDPAKDRGKPHVVISRKFAREFADDPEHPKRVGDVIKLGGKPFDIIGIYETGSMFLDVVLVMDIETARALVNIPTGYSSIYVEADDPSRYDALIAEIEESIPEVHARSMDEMKSNFGALMGYVDRFLLMTVSLALLVGVVGIVNTMLMSTSERFVEFGVMRTNGWSSGDILKLVTLESALLGLMSGALGCLLAWLGTAIANQFVSGGVRLGLTPSLVALGLGLSVVTGTLGGLYPAWRAARLVPMEAIRLGSH